jgi:hypothetical protein
VAAQKWLDSTRVSLCRPLLANLPSGVQAVTSRPSKAARTAAAAPQISGNKTKIGRKQYRNNKVNLRRTAGAPSISNNSSSSAATARREQQRGQHPTPPRLKAEGRRALRPAPTHIVQRRGEEAAARTTRQPPPTRPRTEERRGAVVRRGLGKDN